MQIKTIIVLIFSVLGIVFIAGCTQNANVPSQMSNPTPTEFTIVTTKVSPQPSVAEPTGCILTGSGCIPIPSSPTIPPYESKIMQNNPIIGTYIFDPSQFASRDVEGMEYFSRMGNSEYDFKVVPLDISPDVKWTFRDDGILLFYQNNITCSDDSLRRFWRNSSGNFLRNGSWVILESGNNENKYQINRGNHHYSITYDKNGVRLTQPNFLNMTKVE
jgi:hypothetical protein